MAGNRKSKPNKPGDAISKEHLEISEEDQWRLINDTGILKQPISRPTRAEDEEESTSLGDEIFNSVTLIIPFSFLLLMMEMCFFSLFRQCVTHVER